MNLEEVVKLLDEQKELTKAPSPRLPSGGVEFSEFFADYQALATSDYALGMAKGTCKFLEQNQNITPRTIKMLVAMCTILGIRVGRRMQNEP